MQKSAEWTPKKSKKKVRDENETEGDETPNSVKIRRSSAKKLKVKKIIEEEEEEDEEHSDANMLLLLSATKATKKPKLTKCKSPSKKALKLLIKEAEADPDNDECSSPLQQDLQKLKFKRIMRQFVSSKSASSSSDAFASIQEEGHDTGARQWSPGRGLGGSGSGVGGDLGGQTQTPKGKKKSFDDGSAYLSPKGTSKSCVELACDGPSPSI